MLLADGAPRNLRLEPTGSSLGFLRLVHVSPHVDPRMPDLRSGKPSACGAIWERVPGAVVEARGAGGELLEVELEFAYPGRASNLRFLARAAAGADGTARVRVPYATDAANGEGRALARARWRLGVRAGELAIPEQAVLSGSTLRAD
jgi:hypothetical protein